VSSPGPPSGAQALANDPEADADRHAVERMAGGDESALALLYDRHATPVYSLAMRIVRRPEDADDVTQQVFTQAWQSSARYDASRGAVAAWLLMMARSRALDFLRRRNPARGGTSDDEALAAIPGTDPSVEYVVATREQVDRVRVAIEALPEDQRVAVELAYYDGLTQTEIAARTATPLGTVKTRVRTALQTLRVAVATAPLRPGARHE
jgi:RNA polymerase sigma-70 factor (ECF subfamily)